MFSPDYFAFIWFQGLSFIRDDVSCDWKDIYLTKNEKIVVPNLRVDIFSFRVFNALLQYSHIRNVHIPRTNPISEWS